MHGIVSRASECSPLIVVQLFNTEHIQWQQGVQSYMVMPEFIIVTPPLILVPGTANLEPTLPHSWT